MTKLNSTLQTVFADDAFVRELLYAETAEEVQELLDERGISLTTEEILQVGEIVDLFLTGEITIDKLRESWCTCDAPSEAEGHSTGELLEIGITACEIADDITAEQQHTPGMPHTPLRSW